MLVIGKERLDGHDWRPGPPRMKGEVNIRLTNRAIFVVLGAFLFFWLLRQATHIFVVLFIAVLLASSVSLAATRMERLHIKRGIAILLVYLAILAILAGIVALLVPLIGGEVATLRQNLPSYQDRLNALLTRLPKRNGQTMQVNTLVGNLSGQFNGAARKAGRGALAAGSALVTILLIFVIAFFLAVDPKFPERVVTRFVPPASRRRAFGLMGKIGTGLGYWVRAQLLLALFFGVTFGLGLAIMRMPYALTLGTIGAVLEIIPYVGGFITIILAVLVALTTGKLWLLIAALIWYAVVVNLEAHIVAPKLVGEIVGLNPLVVVLALFLGAEVLGILGALLAVPLAVIVQALLDEFWTFDNGTGNPLPATETSAPLQPGTGAPTPDGDSKPARFEGSRLTPH
ncbi:MAG: AI-2E family transporter [Chloroflexota bacterium]|nr:AI-2E family transporter [Chloroflexota bacterium]